MLLILLLIKLKIVQTSVFIFIQNSVYFSFSKTLVPPHCRSSTEITSLSAPHRRLCNTNLHKNYYFFVRLPYLLSSIFFFFAALPMWILRYEWSNLDFIHWRYCSSNTSGQGSIETYDVGNDYDEIIFHRMSVDLPGWLTVGMLSWATCIHNLPSIIYLVIASTKDISRIYLDFTEIQLIKWTPIRQRNSSFPS